jgi:hypothetical protein
LPHPHPLDEGRRGSGVCQSPRKRLEVQLLGPRNPPFVTNVDRPATQVTPRTSLVSATFTPNASQSVRAHGHGPVRWSRPARSSSTAGRARCPPGGTSCCDRLRRDQRPAREQLRQLRRASPGQASAQPLPPSAADDPGLAPGDVPGALVVQAHRGARHVKRPYLRAIYAQDYREMPAAELQAWVCASCGALIYDRGKHDEWHVWNVERRPA